MGKGVGYTHVSEPSLENLAQSIYTITTYHITVTIYHIDIAVSHKTKHFELQRNHFATQPKAYFKGIITVHNQKKTKEKTPNKFSVPDIFSFSTLNFSHCAKETFGLVISRFPKILAIKTIPYCEVTLKDESPRLPKSSVSKVLLS